MTRTCPGEAELLAFHLGKLPPEKLAALAGHVESCADCEAALQRLDTIADPILAALRKPASGGPAETVDTLAPTPRFPRLPGYEILSQLGRGAMGVVYEARQLRLNRAVAIKHLQAGEDRREARATIEAQALARLQHPNIVQIYEVLEGEGGLYLVLELVEGGSLAGRLLGQPQSPRETAQLIETVARAVHDAHTRGIVHRDLKPANILLEGRPVPSGGFSSPKIADFGLAKRLAADSGHTREGDIVGTPAYMSPEQAAGALDQIGPATDVYSLGVILYEMLTGRVPLQGPTTLATLMMVRNEEPLPPRQLQAYLPPDLDAICQKCLRKDPRKRYASSQALADDLRRYLNGEPTQARAPGPAERLGRWALRYPVAASLLVAFTVCFAFGFWYLSRLTDSLVKEAALESAAQQSDILDEVNASYSDVVKRAIAGHLDVTHDYAGKADAIPIPATFTIELGQQISDRSTTGMQIRLYSDYPFRSRRGGGPHDQFERDAWERLRQNPAEPVYRFEDYKGRPMLRYATARLMQPTCVACHNSHPDSPKTDWKVGDVRGVVEIIRPIDADAARVQAGLRGAFVLVGGVSAVLLALAAVVLLAGRWHRRA
jgi:serine/threonine protein kinase